MKLNFGASKREVPLITQENNSDSMLACIAMIAGFYEDNNDWGKIKKRYNLDELWENESSAINVAGRLNMSARFIDIGSEELEQLELPTILKWQDGHSVVLSEIKGNTYTLYDPQAGIQKLSKEILTQNFEKKAMELSITKQFKKKEKKEAGLKLTDLWNHSKGLKTGLTQLLVLSFIIEILTLSLPFLTQIIIDDVLVNDDYDLLKMLAIGFTIIILLKNVTEYFRSYILMFLGNKISFQFSLNVYSHLLRLPVEFFSSRHMGDIVSRYNSTRDIKDFLTSSVVIALIDGIMVIGTLVLMFVYSSLLTFVALVSILLYGIIRFSMYEHFRKRHEEQLAASADENTNFMENVSGILSIKLFSKEADRISFWQRYLIKALNAGIRIQKLMMLNNLFNGLLLGLETILIAYIGAYLVLEDAMSAGMLLAFFVHKDNLIQKSFRLLDTAINFRMLSVHLKRIGEIALTEKEKNIEGKNKKFTPSTTKSFYEVSRVSYKHEGSKNYLFQNICLQADKEESICIVGKTGCGKSTLFRVMTSLYDPTEGDISLEGIPITNLGLSKFRSNIGAVLQNDIILQGTIAENISFFDPRPDYDRIEYVSKLASIHNNILEKPEQYETHAGNLGTGLSGGEVQRILIARALYRRPKILFLDEATSHLDMETERQVNKAISELKTTRIMIAHRPETIKSADRVLQLTPTGLIPVDKSSIDEFNFK